MLVGLDSLAYFCGALAPWTVLACSCGSNSSGTSTQEGVRAEVSSMVVCWDCAASKTVCPNQNTVASSCLAMFYCGHAKVQRLLSEHLFSPGLSFWQVTVSLLCTPHKEAALPLLT